MNTDHLRALAASVIEMDGKATKGPWIVGPGADVMPPRVGSLVTDEWFVSVHPHVGGEEYRDGFVERWIPQQNAEHSAALIAHYRTSAPQLAEAVIALIAFANQGRTNENEGDWADSYEALDAALAQIGESK